SFMGGLSYISADVYGPPNWGCTMEARASILPACSVTAYRSVRWNSSCDAVVNGVNPTPLYWNYRRY
ncbi:hypothetical protein, partial [Enterococcus casseliflavus]|uniref:hypothetical protein n=1 Tax=Enterococcus casseliflavus TaxID=37734 RepID=UPI003D09D86F